MFTPSGTGRLLLLFLSAFLLITLLPVTGFSQQAGIAVEQLSWLPSGSYLGFAHFDLTGTDPAAELVIKELKKDVDVVSLRGGDEHLMAMTIGLVQGLDKERERYITRGQKQKKGGFFIFFDEIVIAQYAGLDELLTKGAEQGYITREKRIYRFPVFKQKEKDEDSTIWLARINPDTLILTNEHNKLVASLRAGTAQTPNLFDDPYLADIRSIIPATKIWLLLPEQASLVKDLDYARQIGESEKDLATLEKKIEERAEYLVINFAFDSNLVIIAEGQFSSEEAARNWLKTDPVWAQDLFPVNEEFLLEERTEHDGALLRSVFVYDLEKIIQEIQREKRKP